MKTIKKIGKLELVKLDKPVYGGDYAIFNGDSFKTGLCLDAANEIYSKLKKKIYGETD